MPDTLFVLVFEQVKDASQRFDETRFGLRLGLTVVSEIQPHSGDSLKPARFIIPAELEELPNILFQAVTQQRGNSPALVFRIHKPRFGTNSEQRCRSGQRVIEVVEVGVESRRKGRGRFGACQCDTRSAQRNEWNGLVQGQQGVRMKAGPAECAQVAITLLATFNRRFS